MRYFTTNNEYCETPSSLWPLELEVLLLKTDPNPIKGLISYQSLSHGALLSKCGYIFLRRRKVAFDAFPVAMPPRSLLMRLIDVYEMANVFGLLLASILYHITHVLFFVSLTCTQNSIGKSDLRTIYSVLNKNCLLL